MESRLLKLPQEVRDQIYSNALIQFDIPTPRRSYLRSQASRIFDKPIVELSLEFPAVPPRWSFTPRNGKVPRLLYNTAILKTGWALLRLSKQVNKEASEVLYGGVRFVISHNDAAAPFIKDIGIGNASRIRHIEFPLSFYGEISIDALHSCTGLSTLRIRANSALTIGMHDVQSLEGSLRDIDAVQRRLIEGTEVRATLVVEGDRLVLESKEIVEFISRARLYDWNIRREQMTFEFPADGGLPEIDYLIEEPFNAEDLEGEGDD